MDHLPAPAAQQQTPLCPDCEELELLPLPESGPNAALRRQQVQIGIDCRGALYPFDALGRFGRAHHWLPAPRCYCRLGSFLPRNLARTQRQALDAEFGRQPMEADGELLHPGPQQRPGHHYHLGFADARCRSPRAAAHPEEVQSGPRLRHPDGGEDG